MERKLLFKAEDISKFYPGTKALQGVSLDIYEGEVVGLIGENGAGKSTLLKIIQGVEEPTYGTMKMRGEEYLPKNPKEANEHGIGMVFQEQSLIANLTVGQNIFFGNEKKFKSAGLINWGKMYAKSAEVLAEIDRSDIKPNIKVGDLDFATRQMVEIAKVFNAARSTAAGKALILLDEPTSVLNEDEVKQLFHEIKKIIEEGNSVVFISHRLDEVIDISDRIYVFKDGKNAGLIEKAEANEAVLYEKMVGRSSTGEYYKIARQTEPKENVVLEAKDLGLHGAFKNVSFKLNHGEVLGIVGVVGSGKEDICSVIAGDEKPTSGEFFVEGKKARFGSPYDALSAGIISIPKERREEGIMGILSIAENISMSNLDIIKQGGFLSKKKQTNLSAEWIKRLNIKCSGHDEAINQLSGGNAQKVVFARILASGCKILVLNHPTRGVDIGAKEEIYTLIRDITEKGLSVILLGDTLDECIGLSSRILVMKDGLVTKEFNAPKEAKPDEVEIVKYMM